MLRARFGYLPGAAILSLAFSGLAGIINSGRKGLNEYVAVTELSPGRLFHLLVVLSGHSQALKFVLGTETSFGRQYQPLYWSY